MKYQQNSRPSFLETLLKAGLISTVGSTVLLTTHLNENEKKLYNGTSRLYKVLTDVSGKASTLYALELIEQIQFQELFKPTKPTRDRDYTNDTDRPWHKSTQFEDLLQTIQRINAKHVDKKLSDIDKYYISFFYIESSILKISDDIYENKYRYENDSNLYKDYLRHIVRYMAKLLQYLLIDPVNLLYENVVHKVLVVLKPTEKNQLVKLNDRRALHVPFQYSYIPKTDSSNITQDTVVYSMLLKLTGRTAIMNNSICRIFFDISISSIYTVLEESIRKTPKLIDTFAFIYHENQNLSASDNLYSHSGMQKIKNNKDDFNLFDENYKYLSTTYGLQMFDEHSQDLKKFFIQRHSQGWMTYNSVYLPIENSNIENIFYEYFAIYKIVLNVMKLLTITGMHEIKYINPFFNSKIIPLIDIQQLKVAIYYAMGRNFEESQYSNTVVFQETFLYIIDFIIFSIYDINVRNDENGIWKSSKVTRMLLIMRWHLSKTVSELSSSTIMNVEQIFYLYWVCYIYVNSNDFNKLFTLTTIYSNTSNDYQLLSDFNVDIKNKEQSILNYLFENVQKDVSKSKSTTQNDFNLLYEFVSYVNNKETKFLYMSRYGIRYETQRLMKQKPNFEYLTSNIHLYDIFFERFKYRWIRENVETLYKDRTRMKNYTNFLNTIRKIKNAVKPETFIDRLFQIISNKAKDLHKIFLDERGGIKSKSTRGWFANDIEYYDSSERSIDIALRRFAFDDYLDDYFIFLEDGANAEIYTLAFRNFFGKLLMQSPETRKQNLKITKPQINAMIQTILDHKQTVYKTKKDLNRCQEFYGILTLNIKGIDKEDKIKLIEKLIRNILDVKLFKPEPYSNSDVSFTTFKQLFEESKNVFIQNNGVKNDFIKNKQPSRMVFDEFIDELQKIMTDCFSLITSELDIERPDEDDIVQIQSSFFRNDIIIDANASKTIDNFYKKVRQISDDIMKNVSSKGKRTNISSIFHTLLDNSKLTQSSIHVQKEREDYIISMIDEYVYNELVKVFKSCS